MTGPRIRRWGFACPHGWVPFEEYHAYGGCEPAKPPVEDEKPLDRDAHNHVQSPSSVENWLFTGKHEIDDSVRPVFQDGSGLSRREYAAIQLRVPSSGKAWIDRMIVWSNEENGRGRKQEGSDV